MKKKKSIKSKSRFKEALKKFKKSVEKQLGQLNWSKIGIFALALLLMVALKGLLGPEAQVVALGIVKLSTYV